MSRPNFQMILDAEDQNTLRFIHMYQLGDLMEKLKLLNYDTQLIKEMKMKPLSRYYFLRATNPGEQFFMFTSICAFCVRKMGKEFEQPQEFNDPTVLIGKIIKVLQELDISTDFPANKLMQGAGFICWYVLDSLATQALKVNRPHLSRPEIQEEEDIQTEIVENSNELILEKVEEEQNGLLNSEDEFDADDDDDDDDNDYGGLSLNTKNGKRIRDVLSSKHEKPDQNLLNKEQWSIEMERVLPQLKIVVKPDIKDWRARWEQMKQCRDNINAMSDDSLLQLKKVQQELTFAMDKIESREKHLNNDLRPLIEQYKTISTEQSQLASHMKQTKNEINELERQFEKLNHEYETIKIQMEQRGATMSDGSPFINLKKIIARVKEEIIQMDLEISVMQHGIDHEIVKENALFAQIKN